MDKAQTSIWERKLLSEGYARYFSNRTAAVHTRHRVVAFLVALLSATTVGSIVEDLAKVSSAIPGIELAAFFGVVVVILSTYQAYFAQRSDVEDLSTLHRQWREIHDEWDRAWLGEFDQRYVSNDRLDEMRKRWTDAKERNARYGVGRTAYHRTLVGVYRSHDLDITDEMLVAAKMKRGLLPSQ